MKNKKSVADSCPFCGGRSNLYALEYIGTFIVQCDKCGARSGEHSDMVAAVTAWNERAK